MNRTVKLAAIVLTAAALMGFDTQDPWSSIEGEWAYESTANCGGVNSIDFTYDYKRDRDGNVSFPFTSSQNVPRRDRLATVMENGTRDYRVSVRDRLNMMNGGSQVQLDVKHANLLPFARWGQVTFDIIDDDTLQEASATSYGDRLMRAMGGAPLRLVRCPAGE